jgi:hypothetical protein
MDGHFTLNIGARVSVVDKILRQRELRGAFLGERAGELIKTERDFAKLIKRVSIFERSGFRGGRFGYLWIVFFSMAGHLSHNSFPQAHAALKLDSYRNITARTALSRL